MFLRPQFIKGRPSRNLEAGVEAEPLVEYSMLAGSPWPAQFAFIHNTRLSVQGWYRSLWAEFTHINQENILQRGQYGGGPFSTEVPFSQVDKQTNKQTRNPQNSSAPGRQKANNTVQKPLCETDWESKQKSRLPLPLEKHGSKS